jgi:release factor glutamine methyltransferase
VSRTEPGPHDGSPAAVAFDGVRVVTRPGVVMTPRPGTAALVHLAVEWIGSRPARVADVGTGTGVVAIAVARRAPGARIWATDDDEAAVALARANVLRHGLQARIEVLLGNLLEPAPGGLDLVVANLPYHASGRSRDPVATALRGEPAHAIYARGDGLQPNRDLIEACRTQLDPCGALVIQLYGSVLSAGRGELDALLREIEARAADGWRARAAAAAAGNPRSWAPWRAAQSAARACGGH